MSLVGGFEWVGVLSGWVWVGGFVWRVRVVG